MQALCWIALSLGAMPAAELPLLGFAGVSVRVSDLDKTRSFYHNVLGYEEAFELRTPDGQSVVAAFFKINDREIIELVAGLQPDQPLPMTRVALCTGDIEKLQQMLQKRGLTPGAIRQGRDGNPTFSVGSPPGQILESLDFVQYRPASPPSNALGKALGQRRISQGIDHVGVVAKDFDVARKFYVETLGFREYSVRKQANGRIFRVHLQLPGPSGQYIELANLPPQLTRQRAGILAHVCLTVSDLQTAYQQTVDRGAQLKHMQSKSGKQERWPFALFDPDGTRVELKQPKAEGGGAKPDKPPTAEGGRVKPDKPNSAM